MGIGSDRAAALMQAPVSTEEEAARREESTVRDDLTTTLAGEIVRKEMPKAPPARPVEPTTWD